MAESTESFAFGTAELITPEARRDALRWVLVELLPKEAPETLTTLADVFERHSAALRDIVSLAIHVDGPPPGTKPRHVVLRHTAWAALMSWRGALAVTEGRISDVCLPAGEVNRVMRLLRPVADDVRVWAASFGLEHDFMLGTAWKSLLSWAQSTLLPRDSFTNTLQVDHLVTAAQAALPEVRAYNPMMETRGQFLKRFSEYASDVEKGVRQLHPQLVRRPRKSLEQVQWYIRFQVLNTTVARIAAAAGHDDDVVKKAIDRFRVAADLRRVARSQAPKRRVRTPQKRDK